jgi:hypothetical protein
MVDLDAAIGYVVARGDAVERARLSHLRTGTPPPAEILDQLERGQTTTGGWPAQGDETVASIDATCFRLGELDDLAGLGRPAARHALRWLAARQRLDGCWEEDPELAAYAPPWAMPGNPEARFYLTVNASYWLAVATADDDPGATEPSGPYETALTRAARAILDSVDDHGAWPGFLVSGWLAGAVLHRTGWFYESARMFVALGDRAATMSASDAAQMTVALLRAGVSAEDSLIATARQRLSDLQRPDGAWPNEDDPAFDVQTTLAALRALR